MVWKNSYDVPPNAIDEQFFSPTKDAFNYDEMNSGATEIKDDPIATIMAEFVEAQSQNRSK